MEAAFENFKKEGKNNVDNLVTWMQDSKLVEKTNEGKEKAQALFKDVADKQNVNFEHFKAAVTKVASEQKKTLDEAADMLVKKGESVVGAMKAGVSAFKDSLNKKDGKK